MKQKAFVITIFLLIAIMILSSCSSDDSQADPKKTVISMFGAMEKDDKAKLAYLLDLPELMNNIKDDYALQTNEPRVFYSPEEILDDLTGEGQTKLKWFSLQRIINDANINGDEAAVEVTFVDKERSIGYLTKFGLHKKNDRWLIYSFKTRPTQNRL
ncbi:MAG: hypothetical protein ABIJ12_03785 [bacterium]